VPPGFPGFALFGGQAVLERSSLDPVTLRRQFSLALLFIECNFIFAQSEGNFKLLDDF
jgi:hypothetical protein